MSWVATDVTNTPKDSKIEFDVMSNNTLTNVLAITNSGLDTSAIATSWSLIDNNASALSFDAAGATGVLEIVTTNNSEHVKLQAPADAASNQVLVLQSGNRATPADDDEGYVSLYNDDSTGTQVEFSRITWRAEDVTDTTEDASIEFDVAIAGTLTTVANFGDSHGLDIQYPGLGLDVQNTADAASNQVVVLQSGNRATPADDDEGDVSLYNDDSTGTQVEFSRMSWVATDVTNTTKDSKIEFDVMSNNTLTTILAITNSGLDTSAIATSWSLIDNNASALSFDSAAGTSKIG